MSDSPSTDRPLHDLAVRLAVQCRRIVQACLREEEWIDADREFYQIILDGLERLQADTLRDSGACRPMHQPGET